MNIVKLLLIGMMAIFVFSGCAGQGPRVDADMTKEGMLVKRTFTPNPNTHGYQEYQDIENAEYKCSTEYAIHAIASKALENGYPYFSLEFPKGSNQKPLSIVTSKQITRYCVAPYWDKESNLLDDKCHHIGLGQGTPGRIKNVKARFFKKRNPFMPLWDAKKALSDTEKQLINTCWNGDTMAFRKTLERYKTF